MATRLGCGLALGMLLVAAPSQAAPRQPAAAPSSLSLIDAAIRDGRIEAAREHIMRAKAQGDSPALQVRQAELLLSGGLLAEAVAAFGKLADTAPVAAMARQGQGIAQLRMGETEAAIVTLDTAVARDAGLVRAWLARGVAADRMRDWAKAEEAYAKVIGIDPRSAAAFTNRGYSRLLRGQYAESESDLSKAIQFDPKLTIARTNLRLARAMQGNYQAAFEGSDKKQLATDLNTVGFAAMTRGDFAVAESYFNRAMELNPQFDRIAWANLIYLKQLTGKPATGEPAAAAPATADLRR